MSYQERLACTMTLKRLNDLAKVNDNHEKLYNNLAFVCLNCNLWRLMPYMLMYICRDSHLAMGEATFTRAIMWHLVCVPSHFLANQRGAPTSDDHSTALFQPTSTPVNKGKACPSRVTTSDQPEPGGVRRETSGRRAQSHGGIVISVAGICYCTV